MYTSSWAPQRAPAAPSPLEAAARGGLQSSNAEASIEAYGGSAGTQPLLSPLGMLLSTAIACRLRAGASPPGDLTGVANDLALGVLAHGVKDESWIVKIAAKHSVPTSTVIEAVGHR